MRAAKQLQLDPAERQAARRLHNDVTSHLSVAGLIAGSFLQGSFARMSFASLKGPPRCQLRSFTRPPDPIGAYPRTCPSNLGF